MISDVLTFLLWIVVAVALVAMASWLAHRSYRRFLQKSRGPDSIALPCAKPATPLDALLGSLAQGHPGETGLTLLLDNTDAFAARMQTATQAGRSLVLMYYI